MQLAVSVGAGDAGVFIFFMEFLRYRFLSAWVYGSGGAFGDDIERTGWGRGTYVFDRYTLGCFCCFLSLHCRWLSAWSLLRTGWWRGGRVVDE